MLYGASLLLNYICTPNFLLNSVKSKNIPFQHFNTSVSIPHGSSEMVYSVYVNSTEMKGNVHMYEEDFCVIIYSYSGGK